MKQKLLFLLFALFSLLNAKATILNVPTNYTTIQSAINASVNGDTILVAAGTYFENINFRGKKVLLTSLYYTANDTSYISKTIINGSTPVKSDTASCVIFNSGEDLTSILQGFTITGGAGTKWKDIHNAKLYREGGGILIELSSPTIRHNNIINNTATNTTGVVSAGGGGIRIGDGNPEIYSNQISFNQGRYGAGIVLNYTGCKISGNVIASNTGGSDYFGGSGIWIYQNLNTTSIQIINNTIVDNYSSHSSGTGGISVWSASNLIIKNNIIWNNLPALQIKTSDATPNVAYSNIQGGYTGIGNINQDPLFSSQDYFLSNGSPCIDAGDIASIYNDIEDSGSPGNAKFPSRGLLRNDIGAYGGPNAILFPFFQNPTGFINNLSDISEINIFPNPFDDILNVTNNNDLLSEVILYDVNSRKLLQLTFTNTVSLRTEQIAKGIYIYEVRNKDNVIKKGKVVKQ